MCGRILWPHGLCSSQADDSGSPADGPRHSMGSVLAPSSSSTVARAPGDNASGTHCAAPVGDLMGQVRMVRISVMILPQVHLRKPCYDFYFL